MAGRIHPPVNHPARASITLGEILSNCRVAVAAVLDPDERLSPIRGDVIEVMFVEHVSNAIIRRGIESPVEAQRRESALLSLAIHRLEDRLTADAAGLLDGRCRAARACVARSPRVRSGEDCLQHLRGDHRDVCL